MLAVKNTKLLVSMPKNLSDEVTEFAKELNQNKSTLINQALEFYFDHLDLQIAKKRSLDFISDKYWYMVKEVAENSK